MGIIDGRKLENAGRGGERQFRYRGMDMEEIKKWGWGWRGKLCVEVGRDGTGKHVHWIG